MSDDLENLVREKLRNRPRDMRYSDIADALKISVSWLCKFSCGLVKNPKYKTLTALNNYLTERTK